MKIKLIFLALVFWAFTSCNHNDEMPENNHSHGEAEQVNTQEQEHNHDTHSEETHVSSQPDDVVVDVTLNNGEKWQTDVNTKKHTDALNSMLDKFEKDGDKTAEAYHNLAEKMSSELSDLIKSCRMEGAEHDALHLWLEPVLNQVKKLRDSQNEQDVRKYSRSLFLNIRSFKTFFK